MNATLTDALGVALAVGDRVRVIHYGWAVRLQDTGRVVTTTGFTRVGNLTHDSAEVANGKALRPGCVAVLRRDGADGFEGNRPRCTCGAREFPGCFCGLSLRDFLASPGQRWPS